MPISAERTVALCREIANQIRAAAADKGQGLTLAERRELVEIALALEQRAGLGGACPPE